MSEAVYHNERKSISVLRLLKSILTAPSKRHLEDQYRTMHEQGRFKGRSWSLYLDDLHKSIPDLQELTILDFGCGPHGGLSQRYPENTRPYDPYVEKYNEPPWGVEYDVIFSSDVLEHVPLRDLNELFRSLKSCNPKHVFLVISTRWAMKNLPDGSNAHITVRPPEWWHSYVQNQLGDEYVPVLASADMLRKDVKLCFTKNKHE